MHCVQLSAVEKEEEGEWILEFWKEGSSLICAVYIKNLCITLKCTAHF